MLCPKCAGEMDALASSCPHCGFTFHTPKNEMRDIPRPALPEETLPLYRASQALPELPAVRPMGDFSMREERTPALTTGQYFRMLLLALVPLVGFIFFIVWAAREGAPERRRFAIAMIIVKSLGILFALGAGLMFWLYQNNLLPYFFY